MKTQSIWKEVPGYDGLYCVSQDGDVMSFHDRHYGKLLSPKTTHAGYRSVQLNKDASSKDMHVHRIVALAWLPQEPGRNTVNHKNGAKTDNRVENLEWCTSVENTAHAMATNLVAHGERHGMSKLTSDKIPLIIEKRKAKWTLHQLAAEFGVSTTAIARIIKGRAWVRATAA